MRGREHGAERACLSALQAPLIFQEMSRLAIAWPYTTMLRPQLAILLMVAQFSAPSLACDAGVFWGQNCSTDPVTGNPDPACDGYPTNANATSTSTVLVWEQGGEGSGGQDNLGGDVFLSTTLNMGCGGGYYGSQLHWNSTFMNLDWAIWDIAGDVKGRTTRNTHPISPPGHPKRCQRYSGEGFGTSCGIGPDGADGDDFMWEMGTRYTLNISLLEGNVSAALFGATITNGRTKEVIEIGKILTTNPGPDNDNPQGYACDRMLVGGGSFQEYYDGDTFTSWASISGPRFRGVAGQEADIVPTGFQDCMFFGNCSGGYGGCENQTLFFTAGGAANCSKEPVPAAATCGHDGLPSVSFKGGPGQPVPSVDVPPWYRWAANFSADGSSGPSSRKIRVPLFAARTLNATGQYRVTLSVR